MLTKKREVRKLIELLLDEYGALCTFQHPKPLSEAIVDAIIPLFATKRKTPKPPAKNLFPLAQALSAVCVIDYDANKPKLYAEAKRLSRAIPCPTPDLIMKYYGRGGTWYEQDWRGRRGDSPQLGQVRLTWAQLTRGRPASTQGLDAPSAVPVI